MSSSTCSNTEPEKSAKTESVSRTRRIKRPSPSFKNPLQVISPFSPSGDQPKAIKQLAKKIEEGEKTVVLEGATGTGKSATAAWLIEKVQRPTLVLVHNKTLAAQIATELRELLPENAVTYFVSHFAFYQPEAYVPQTDTFIEKDSAINEEVERLRHSATMSLLTRRDTVVVASVSAIYGLGTPEEYTAQALELNVGMVLERDDLLRSLITMGYERNDLAPARGEFRTRGDTIDVYPTYSEEAVRIELFGDELEAVTLLNSLTGEKLSSENTSYIFPATHYVSSPERTQKAVETIEKELKEQLTNFTTQNKLLEHQRLKTRTEQDLELIKEIGTCAGIENYSRHFDGRAPGSPPATLLDYFPEDFLIIIDESHVTLPQIGAMYEGDASRKRTLVEHGFRLPSALDNRPLTFTEFLERAGQKVCLSATPGKWELQNAESDPVQQIIRPTGLIDPIIEIRKTKGQIDDIMEEVAKRAELKERTLITTLTKKMAEDLTAYLAENGTKVKYLHSGIDTMERISLLKDLRSGEFDVLVGINLLREGLDLPEVSLVAILDADKQGFLRSATALIQTIGRAARNVSGKVIMYADSTSDAMEKAIDETKRRRDIQIAHNKKHGITPMPLEKKIVTIGKNTEALVNSKEDKGFYTLSDLEEVISVLEEDMQKAASELHFEEAARMRDELKQMRKEYKNLKAAGIS